MGAAMKTFKVTLAIVFFVTSINFNEQVLKSSDNVLISKWSVSFGIQSSHALRMALEDQFSVNFE